MLFLSRCKDGSELGTFASCPRCPQPGCQTLLQPPLVGVGAPDLQDSDHPTDFELTSTSTSSSISTWSCASCSNSVSEEDILKQARSETTTFIFCLNVSLRGNFHCIDQNSGEAPAKSWTGTWGVCLWFGGETGERRGSPASPLCHRWANSIFSSGISSATISQPHNQHHCHDL